MSKFPFMPLDIDAYFGATRHLTTQQHGAYLLLLMEAWRRSNCTIPDNDEILARLACMDLMQWHTNKPTIMELWDYDGRSKGWTQTKLKKERKYVAEKREKNRDAAVSRWNKKKKTNANAYANAMPLIPSLSQGSKEPLKKGKNDDFLFEEKRWFSDKEIAFLKEQHPNIDVDKKLSERKFRIWCFNAEPQNPLIPARNWFEKQNRVQDANEKLIEIHASKKPIGASPELLKSLEKRNV